VGNHESALREYGDPTGKRSAVKVACCVWGGGKAATPYLSRQNGPFASGEGKSAIFGVWTSAFL